MKKIVVMLVTMMFVAGSAMAMETISDGQMDQITGQAGVSITVDDFKMYQDINGLWYTDTDGLVAGVNDNPTMGMDAVDTTGDGASIGLKNLSVMIHVNAITGVDSTTNFLSSVGRPLQGDYSAMALTGQNFFNYDNDGDGADDTFIAKAINIDVVGRLPVLTHGLGYNAIVLIDDTSMLSGLAGVKIGLGTMEIVQSKMTMEVAMNDKTPLTDPDNVQAQLNQFATTNGYANAASDSFGEINIGQTTMAILDGSLEIAPH